MRDHEINIIAHSRLYQTWRDLNRRCKNPNRKDFKYYGARGISVSAEFSCFNYFYTWAVLSGFDPKDTNLTIERIDNDGDYSQSNCTFIPKEFQVYNRRMLQSNTSGGTGIHKTKSGRFRAGIGWQKKRYTIGTYDSLEQAIKARNEFIKLNNLPHKTQNI